MRIHASADVVRHDGVWELEGEIEAWSRLKLDAIRHLHAAVARAHHRVTHGRRLPRAAAWTSVTYVEAGIGRMGVALGWRLDEQESIFVILDADERRVHVKQSSGWVIQVWVLEALEAAPWLPKLCPAPVVLKEEWQRL